MSKESKIDGISNLNEATAFPNIISLLSINAALILSVDGNKYGFTNPLLVKKIYNATNPMNIQHVIQYFFRNAFTVFMIYLL